MPTLFRFIVFTGMVAGLVYASVYVLAEYFEPVPKEITKPVRHVQIRE